MRFYLPKYLSLGQYNISIAPRYFFTQLRLKHPFAILLPYFKVFVFRNSSRTAVTVPNRPPVYCRSSSPKMKSSSMVVPSVCATL